MFSNNGLQYAFGLVFKALTADAAMNSNDVVDALVLAVQYACFNGFGIVAGLALQRFSPRATALAGCAAGVLGFATSVLAPNAPLLILTYGVLVGCGAACVSTATVFAASQHFTRHRGLALGIVLAGSGVGALALSPLVQLAIRAWGWRDTLLVLAAVALVVDPIASLPFNSVLHPRGPQSDAAGHLVLSVEGRQRFEEPHPAVTAGQVEHRLIDGFAGSALSRGQRETHAYSPLPGSHTTGLTGPAATPGITLLDNKWNGDSAHGAAQPCSQRLHVGQSKAASPARQSSEPAAASAPPTLTIAAPKAATADGSCGVGMPARSLGDGESTPLLLRAGLKGSAGMKSSGFVNRSTGGRCGGGAERHSSSSRSPGSDGSHGCTDAVTGHHLASQHVGASKRPAGIDNDRLAQQQDSLAARDRALLASDDGCSVPASSSALTDEGAPLTYRDLLRMPLLMRFLLGLSLYSGCFFSVLAHGPAFAAESGVQDPALLLTYQGIANTVGRLLLGKLSDSPRVDKLALQQACMLVAGVAAAGLAFAPASLPLWIAYNVVFGSCAGSITATAPTIVANLVPANSFSLALGLTSAMQGPSILALPPIIGELRRRCGSYAPAPWLVITCVMTVASVIVAPSNLLLPLRAALRLPGRVAACFRRDVVR
jgi:MFS family permease